MRYVSLFTLFVFCLCQFLPYNFFVQAASFSIIDQRVSLDTGSFTNQQDTLSIPPNTLFRFEVSVGNNTADIFSGITYHTEFPSWIIYQAETSRAYPNRNLVSLQWSISLDQFYPPSVPNYYNWVELQPNDTYQMRRILLKFPQNWSIYENVLKNHFSANNGTYLSDTKETIIYVNVKPHITDYYFETLDATQTVDQVQWLHSEPINLVVKVKDYNGCANIAWWNITANLSQLWLSETETLSYDSCLADDKTAIFKKTWITTNASLWIYTFPKNYFTAIDADGNINDSTDSRFWSEDKTSSITLKVVESLTPVIDFVSLSETLLWWPEKTNSLLSVSSTSSWNIKAVVGWSIWCEGWVEISPLESYVENTQKIFDISSSLLSEWNNTVYVCLEKEGYTGSLSRDIVKDTIWPDISAPVYSVNVWLNDTQATFACSEDWYFAWELLGTSTLWTWTGTLNWTTTSANTINTFPIPNSLLQSGQNIFHVFCKDNATNISYKTWSISKVIPVASMQNLVHTFWDFDSDYSGLDGRDIILEWDIPTADMSSFSSYYIYVIPSNIEFNISTHGNNYIAALKDPNIQHFLGTSDITKDSTNTSFVSWWSYKACVLIRGKDLSYWEVWCSQSWVLTADTVQNAKILSAKFTSNTQLELTTDTTLDTDLENHSGALLSYNYNGNVFSPLWVQSVQWSKINFLISPLENLWASWSNLIIQTWAIRSAIWWYNNYFFSWGLKITDGQIPTITNFKNNTLSSYNNFFSGSIDVQFHFDEAMKWWWPTKFIFTRVGGNSSPDKILSINDPQQLTVWDHTQTISLSGFLLPGSHYNLVLEGQDLAWNSITTSPISIKFDNVWPLAPALTQLPNTSNPTPTLSWSAAIDNNGNGAWVKEYVVKIYSWTACESAPIQTLQTNTLSKQTSTLVNGNYAWNVTAIDNMWNNWDVSECWKFIVDTTIPTISQEKISDILLSSTQFTKANNTIEITANLTNTDVSHIKADLSALTGNATHTQVVCATPPVGITCNYESWKVTYRFQVWFAGSVVEAVRQIKLIVSTISEVTTIEKLVSITVDNTPPTTGTISAPIASTYWWNNLNIAWSGITDSNLDFIKIEYSADWWNNYNFVYSWANISPYNWNITSLSTGNNYRIKISSRDKSGNENMTQSQIFALDKTKPVIAQWVFLMPWVWNFIPGNKNYILTWNPQNITDNQTLPLDPITLEYSLNNGWVWNVLVNNISNSWSYNWSIWALNSTQAKLRIKARDNVWNESDYVESWIFVIDSQKPTLSLSIWTPPNGSYINAWWFDTIASLNDNIGLQSVSYSFKRNSNSTYWNGSAYTENLVWNTLQEDINTLSYNLNQIIAPEIINGENYDLVIKALDKAWNEILSTPRQYIADTLLPAIHINNLSNTYFSGSVAFSGTANDALSWISSVKIAIKKWLQYWNGNVWGNDEVLLATSTSNNYANWSYNFNVPGIDDDGQNYEIIAYAYDKSYKINNSASQNIQIILDKVWPVIANDIFTFTPSWQFYAWGSNFNITWNPEKISTSWAWFSHIKLEYNNAWTFTTIAENISNSWSYNFTLPEIDSNISIIISAYDTIWNLSNKISSPFILIDSTPPTIVNVETMDLSANGKIDALKVTMSESIVDTSIVLSDFMISWVGVPSSWETWNTTNDNVFLLKFNDFGDTSTTPQLSYIEWSLQDLAGKKMSSISNIVSVDTASPRILQAEIFANNSWIFNSIEVLFSENISSTTDTSAFSLNNGLVVTSTSVSWNKALLQLSWWSVNTDATGYTLWFQSLASWKDTSNNQAGSLGTSLVLIDKAKPVIISSKISDTNYVANKLEFTFSESIIWDLSWFSINEGNISNGTISGNTAYFMVGNINGTHPNTTFSYVWNIEDKFWNILESISNRAVQEKISPKLNFASTLDQNANGKIDAILLDFSESLNGNFSDIHIWVNGYISDSYALSGTTQVIVWIQEKSIFDTQAIPSIQIISNNSLKDLNDNGVKLQNIISQDAVWPIIIWARYEPGSHKIFMNFSENIDINDFISSNFVLQNAGNYTITWVNSVEKSITLSGENIDFSSSEISFVENKVRDGLWNMQKQTYFVSISAPIIINEIMVSENENNNYVELHNLSDEIINIENWQIAWVTLPSWAQIWANGYYLISKSSSENSLINIQPDLVANIVFSGNRITLNDGNIDIDIASLVTWLWDTTLPASIERKNPITNGLWVNSWYRALVSQWFDNPTTLWTPKTQNVFDIEAPNLEDNLENNLILPVWNYDISYVYSDNISLNIQSVDFDIQKWNGNSFISLGNQSYSWTITQNNAQYVLKNIGYGRYRAQFSIADMVWNISQSSKEFYVDDFQVTLDENQIDLGVLQPGNLTLANDVVQIQVKTLGAKFEIDHTYTENDLGDWDNSTWFWACEWVSCTNLENYKNKSLIQQEKDLQTSWELKTYTYKVKYGSLIDNLKSAWIYEVKNNYNVNVEY